jgi:hypothetical protein
VGPRVDWRLRKKKSFSLSWNRTHVSDRPPGGPAIILDYPTPTISGFGGPVVSMLAFGTQDREFAPGRSRRIFQGEKILPSEGK